MVGHDFMVHSRKRDHDSAHKDGWYGAFWLTSSHSRNCTKHNCRCDYMDGPRPRDKRPQSPSTADLLWSSEIKKDIDVWRRTEQFPFPEMPLQSSLPVQNYSTTDLRLIHHVSSISHDLQARGVSQFVIWADKIPTYVVVTSIRGRPSVGVG